MGRGLLGIEETDRSEIQAILDRARDFQPHGGTFAKVNTCTGSMVVNLFFENSTRTRSSFEIAARRLGAETLSITASGSSVTKGESLVDTLNTLVAMHPAAIVMRHSASGAPHFLARHLTTPIINAGDGTHEHPTQALLDARTILDRIGRLEGLRVAIIGDIAHSRVARSNLWGLKALGAHVTVCGPRSMMPKRVADLGVDVEYDLRRAVRDADAINVLRIQFERHGTPNFPNAREYSRLFGITNAVLNDTPPACFVMHPGPMNRGVEIASDVADGRRAVILQQVTNGVAVRMAVCYLFAGGIGQTVDGGERSESASGDEPPRTRRQHAASA
jgi:aspartate carbamoyltransferase catalytic subunit